MDDLERRAMLLAGIMIEAHAASRIKLHMKTIAEVFDGLAKEHADYAEAARKSHDGELFQVSKIFQAVYEDAARRIRKAHNI